MNRRRLFLFLTSIVSLRQISAAIKTVPKIVSFTPRKFTTEGVTNLKIEITQPPPPITIASNNNNITSCLCRITPPLTGTTFGVQKFRSDSAKGIVTFPCNSSDKRVSNKPGRNVIVTCTPPKAISEGPALFSISTNNGQNWTSYVKVYYYNLFEVALDKRPYIYENNAKLLIRTAAAPQQGGNNNILLTDKEKHVNVEAYLPCINKRWNFKGVPWNGMLETNHEISLDLPFDEEMPTTIHNDIIVSISFNDDGRKDVKKQQLIKKEMRFHRVPPPPNHSIEIVQVNHAKKSLDVNQQTYNGAGFYVSGISGSNLTMVQLMIEELKSVGINQAMFYGLSGLTPSIQLSIFKIASKINFKILYDLPTGNVSINHGGPFNNTKLLQDMINNVTLVKNETSLLGYYICDDCCSNQHDISLQSQAYNIIKNLDPYHAIIGAVDCQNSW